MEVDKDMRLLIDKGASSEELRDAALQRGMTPLSEDARRKVLEGVTTLDEMLRVTYTV
jgi:type IV pilus assembly protein PilB